jgi:hypothetical protein
MLHAPTSPTGLQPVFHLNSEFRTDSPEYPMDVLARVLEFLGGPRIYFFLHSKIQQQTQKFASVNGPSSGREHSTSSNQLPLGTGNKTAKGVGRLQHLDLDSTVGRETVRD